MFVVKSIVIQINGLAYGSINRSKCKDTEPNLRATHFQQIPFSGIFEHTWITTFGRLS